MTIWQRKLLAFLHDPPNKPFNIAEHRRIAAGFLRAAGFTDEDAWTAFDHVCDHTSSAADRFPFPGSSAGAGSKFHGDAATPFRHPLGGGQLAFQQPMESAELAEDVFQQVQKGFKMDELPGAAQDWANFFLHWRRWPIEAASQDQRVAHLPADTRLPDHTIWCHMSLTSAMQGCVDGKELRPAFLLFQLGPVQEFIAQARSTRDLWAGSYLLSWLMAHGLKAVTDEVGPDAVIFPSLRGQPIFDALHRAELFEQVTFAGLDGTTDTLWTRLQHTAEALTMPGLPNRFLALVPEARAAELAGAASQAIQAELERIGQACWAWLKEHSEGLQDDWRGRWDAQLSDFLQPTWFALPWREAGDEVEQLVKGFADLPGGKAHADDRCSAAAGLAQLHALATRHIPQSHRDKRFYTDAAKTVLNNRGFCWPVYYALTDLGLASRRNTRDFAAWQTDAHQVGAVKDALSGKEEVIGSEEFWDELRDRHQQIFKAAAHAYGAVNLIKRIWPHTGDLRDRLGLKEREYWQAIGFDSAPEIAHVGTAPDDPKLETAGYFAVLAMDGDEMGKWISGAKTPAFGEQLAEATRTYFEDLDKAGDALEAPRPLSPAYHVQFSEALGNFALYAVPRVVKAFSGALIYAGGDDVLAMLPAAKAIPCARALRAAFRGEDPDGLLGREGVELAATPGCAGWLNTGEDYPLLVPGPRAEVSCGIAIAHCREPLQMVVEQARQAEKQAKRELGRAAFAVTLYKRGGEIVEWGAKWQSHALPLLGEFERLCYEEPMLSNRFPHALAALLRPYYERDEHHRCTTMVDEATLAVTRAEFAHVMGRQASGAEAGHRRFVELAHGYLDELAEGKRPLDDFEKLFLAAAFMHRTEGGE